MPEFAGEVTLRSLLVSAGVAATGIAASCFVLTLAARRFPPAAVWLASSVIVGTLGVFSFVRLYLDPRVMQESDLRYAAFFLGALLGLPSAVAVWLAVWRATRPQRRGLLFDSSLVAAGFTVALPAAAIIASLPEVLALVD
jgi:hypothetical protein